MFYIVYNPTAGNGKAKLFKKKFKELLEKYGIEHKIVFTSRQGDAALLAQKAAMDGFRKIVVFGGDGTVNEVVNGIFASEVDPREFVLGWIPFGSGKDWGRTIDVPFEMEEAVKVLKEGEIFEQDVGVAEYETRLGERKKRFFVNMAGLLFDGYVTLEANRLKRKTRLSYFAKIFPCLLRYRGKKVRLVLDDLRMEPRLFSMNVAIGRYNGGGMMQAPHAVPDDGLLAVTLINDIGNLKILMNVYRVFTGTLLEHPGVEGYQAKTVEVEFEEEEPFELDGESFFAKKVRFEVIPKALRVLVKGS